MARNSIYLTILPPTHNTKIKYYSKQHGQSNKITFLGCLVFLIEQAM